jgi:hypothetical protein
MGAAWKEQCHAQHRLGLTSAAHRTMFGQPEGSQGHVQHRLGLISPLHRTTFGQPERSKAMCNTGWG